MSKNNASTSLKARSLAVDTAALTNETFLVVSLRMSNSDLLRTAIPLNAARRTLDRLTAAYAKGGLRGTGNIAEDSARLDDFLKAQNEIPLLTIMDAQIAVTKGLVTDVSMDFTSNGGVLLHLPCASQASIPISLDPAAANGRYRADH
jgi:hypothetical protein